MFCPALNLKGMFFEKLQNSVSLQYAPEAKMKDTTMRLYIIIARDVYP